ncbi:MAG: hypothetical protein KJ630_06095 [Proteobacteria bacterium]|nr:hypothetical protein [Pseudomonadota bacterium]
MIGLLENCQSIFSDTMLLGGSPFLFKLHFLENCLFFYVLPFVLGGTASEKTECGGDDKG